MNYRVGTWAAALMAGLCAAAQAARPTQQAAPVRPNVLFIAVDDLRPSFGAYGGPIKTPNIDRLAARGTTFMRAYCQQAVCSPSRSSLMTGRRPDATKVWDLKTHFRTALPNAVTIAQHFKANGYHAEGLSKIFHGGYNDEPSWSVPWWSPRSGGVEWRDPATRADVQARRAAARAAGRDATRERGPAWESHPSPDTDYSDGKTAEEAIKRLEARKSASEPFFLAVGFLKPHLPFVAPKKYFDLYNPDEIQLSPTDRLPEGAPAFTTNNSGELRSYSDIPKMGPPTTPESARRLKHAYYAAASFMDAQLGKVLDALERLDLARNTIVVLWGDHGWQLGEHGLWTKHTNFEIATHAPLLFALPGQVRRGEKARGLAEFVDVFPTLCAAASIPVPTGLDGASLLPVIQDPSRSVKDYAVSQYPRAQAMGYSIRTDRWRYTEWGTAGRELYDEQSDPNETRNVVELPENAVLVRELSEKLHRAYPSSAGPRPDRTAR